MKDFLIELGERTLGFPTFGNPPKWEEPKFRWFGLAGEISPYLGLMMLLYIGTGIETTLLLSTGFFALKGLVEGQIFKRRWKEFVLEQKSM